MKTRCQIQNFSFYKNRNKIEYYTLFNFDLKGNRVTFQYDKRQSAQH